MTLLRKTVQDCTTKAVQHALATLRLLFRACSSSPPTLTSLDLFPSRSMPQQQCAGLAAGHAAAILAHKQGKPVQHDGEVMQLANTVSVPQLLPAIRLLLPPAGAPSAPAVKPKLLLLDLQRSPDAALSSRIKNEIRNDSQRNAVGNALSTATISPAFEKFPTLSETNPRDRASWPPALGATPAGLSGLPTLHGIAKISDTSSQFQFVAYTQNVQNTTLQLSTSI